MIQVRFGGCLLSHEIFGLAFRRFLSQSIFLIEFGLLGNLRFEGIDFRGQFAVTHLGLLQLLGNPAGLGLTLLKSIGFLQLVFLLFQPFTESLLQIVVGLLSQVEGGH